MLFIMLEMLDNDGDKQFFSELYKEYMKSMLYAAHQVLKNKFDAEDAVHQAFINIANNFAAVKRLSRKQMKSYFVTASVNVAKNILRSNKHMTFEYEAENIPSNESIDDKVVEKVSSEELADEIGKLPDIYVQVLILSYIYDCSDKQIAKQLSLSHSAVRKRRERGKIYLYKKFTKGENGIEIAI